MVPLGVDANFFQVVRRPEPFLLSVSTLHPHKNLDRLLRVFGEFRRGRPEFRLVIAGLRGFNSARLDALRQALGLAGSVDFTGWIPREELYDLYARAFAFVYPSTFEGFGLPVLEALAAGVPTACSRIEPMASTAADAALQFDPADEADMAGAIKRIVGDEPLRVRLAAAGPRRAALFSWIATARATLAALVEAAQGS
jgi:glycosyltransferase involved in cell wall biosynthesis